MMIKISITTQDLLEIYEYGETFWVIPYSDRAYELLKKQKLTVEEMRELDNMEGDFAETEYGKDLKKQVIKRTGVVYIKEAEKYEALCPSMLLILVNPEPEKE